MDNKMLQNTFKLISFILHIFQIFFNKKLISLIRIELIYFIRVFFKKERDAPLKKRNPIQNLVNFEIKIKVFNIRVRRKRIIEDFLNNFNNTVKA